MKLQMRCPFSAPNPRTEAQKAASRRNGAKSRATVTPADAEHPAMSGQNSGADGSTGSDKSASRNNAFRHALLAKAILIEGESRAIFRDFMTNLENTFTPATPYEITLVETMAIAKWRQMRLAGMERAAVRHQLRLHASQENAAPLPADPVTRAWIAFTGINQQSRTLELMNRCESRCDSQYNKALSLYLKARRLREAEDAAAITVQDLR